MARFSVTEEWGFPERAITPVHRFVEGSQYAKSERNIIMYDLGWKSVKR